MNSTTYWGLSVARVNAATAAKRNPGIMEESIQAQGSHDRTNWATWVR